MFKSSRTTFHARRIGFAWWGMLLILSSGFSSWMGRTDCSAKELEAKLKPLIDAHPGQVGLYIEHLETGEQYGWRPDAVQPTASLIKLPVMVAAYRLVDRKQLELTKHLTLTDADKVPGSGILTYHFSPGATLSVRDAIRLMIRYSDNTATNLVVDQIGLPTTATTMATLGFAETRLHAKVFRGDTTIAPERSRQYGLGSTTARETVQILKQLYTGQMAAADSCMAMMEHLFACDDRTMLLRELPSGTKVAHKTGAVAKTRCDAGIIFSPQGPFAICVLTTDNEDQRWDDDNAAQILIGRLARLTFDHFKAPEADGGRRSDAVNSSNRTEDPILHVGATGRRVEYLQRTLNARLQPSPALAVDGDFGPSTESAVRRFQESQGLKVTGIVDAEFWEKLGPIVEQQPVPAPELVNAEKLPTAPRESLDGTPHVSCDAWIVTHAKEGRVIGSHQADQRLHFASTTKIMTAWLIVQLAEKQPEVLDETLTMSVRADETVGSTSGIRAGEQLTIREALYGLLLPSGNDMSVALAEHFGTRLSPVASSAEKEQNEPDPIRQFVMAMNIEAARLKMHSTTYENPHGLTSAEHLSTVHDLALLARATLASPLFRSYVATRQRGTTVTGPGGYRRHVLWTNTNQLLDTEGYDGIKTGTTDRAGACLVSTAERDGDRLIVVVLGSSGSKARYSDSKNLYRWGWLHLKNSQ
jgi:D-alanyl-D-alanine carboxypeptidase (penicillin-binding protein 5/6)